VAKRSPILGYNHNVRYRGLVFHVQTEDSGVLSPHLFTHLFHEGVIVSTRKLVYDAGASEEAIKALMQAQHKAVLKDLKLRAFDDKIDQYLGSTPGLEPRVRASGSVPAEPAPAVAAAPVAAPELVEPPVEPAAPEPITAPEPTPPSIEIVRDDLVATAPTRQMDEATKEALAREAAAEAVRDAAARVAAAQEAARDEAPTSARTQTADRTSRASQFRSMPPPEAVPVELNAGPTIPTAAPAGPATPPPPPARAMRAATPPPIPSRSRAGITLNVDSSPEIEIIPGDEESGRRTRDTDIDAMLESGVPAAIGDDRTRPSDDPGVHMRAGSDSAAPQSRPASHGAATLPAAVRPPSRPSITPAQVVSRPLPPEQRNRENTDAIEVYAPAPPSVELPSGERAGSAGDRPASGQYSMTRRDPGSNRVAIPSGLGRPRTPVAGSPTVPRPPSTDGRTKQPSETGPIARQRQQSDGVPTVDKSRTPHVTAPISSPSRPATQSSPQGNVVMTRPAVIVGAPQKPPGPVTGRIRKAREDEGRGFGQGLISEKSLDEVILAYLSEDAEEK
jgi:hypothetical protein